MAAMVLAALVSGGLYFAARGGFSGRLIEIDRAQPQTVQFQLDINSADWAEFTVLPGVGELLEALAARGDVAIGLLTGNVREGARRKLSHYKLWHWFPFGGFGDDHMERSDIAAAALAAAKLHLNGGSSAHGEVVVIGDTHHDVNCGRSIGAGSSPSEARSARAVPISPDSCSWKPPPSSRWASSAACSSLRG